MLRDPIGVLKDGIEVFDRPKSHLPNDEQLLPLVREALKEIDVEAQETVKAYEHTFNRTVGTQLCVETGPEEDVLYAKRKFRKGHSRFVKGREGLATDTITLVLMKNQQSDELYYILITAFYGKVIPKEPWDEHAEADSRTFWDTHALIWGSSEIIPDSVTSECPW